MTGRDTPFADETLTLSQHLARFAHGIELGALPDVVVTEAKFCLLDTLGCIIAGSALPEGREFCRMETVVSPGVQARALTQDGTLSTEGAARVNGYLGDILELNDLIGGHASIGSVAAALALSETYRLTGPQLLRALIAGIEVTARVNMGYRESHGGQDNLPFTQVGISSEGIPSTIGVSALTAVALGLPESRVAAAIGIGATLAGWCPVEVLFGQGGTVKPMMFGSWPATVGILAGRYAQAGMTGPPRLLESDIGYYSTVANDYDADIVKGSRGWQLARPRRKWHACCGFIHAAVDGVAALRRAHGAALFRDARIDIGVVPPVAALLEIDTLPTNATEARFHGKYHAALAAHGVDCITPECNDRVAFHLTEPGVAGTMERITFSGRDDLPHFSHGVVRVVGPEGMRAEWRVAGYKGSADNPLSHDEVIAKFKRLAAPVLPFPDDYIANVLSLEEHSELDWLFSELLRSAPPEQRSRTPKAPLSLPARGSDRNGAS